MICSCLLREQQHHFVFRNELKMLDLAMHGRGRVQSRRSSGDSNTGSALGRGSVWLKLTREQYGNLRG